MHGSEQLTKAVPPERTKNLSRLPSNPSGRDRKQRRSTASSITPVPSRRGFLRSAVAGLTGVTTWESLLPAAALAGEEDPATSPLREQFDAAAKEFGVPVDVLLAMGYVNTRLEMPPPEACDYRKGDPEGRGAYGVMALVRNPFSDTLGKASRLTGVPAERLEVDRSANIRGGAALLADSQGRKQPDDAVRWLGAVHGKGGGGRHYAATSGVGAGELYAGQVGEALRKGFSVRTESGERVSMAAGGTR